MKEDTKRMRGDHARAVLRRLGIDPATDFHALRADRVQALLAEADAMKYRAPAGASGSRGRYFYAKMVRESQWH